MEDKIKPLATGLHNARKKRDSIADQMKDIKTCHYLDILELSKDKATAKEMNITNEAGRSIELDNRLEQDSDYQSYKNRYDQVCTDIELIQIDLEHERMKFKVWYVEQLREVGGVV